MLLQKSCSATHILYIGEYLTWRSCHHTQLLIGYIILDRSVPKAKLATRKSRLTTSRTEFKVRKVYTTCPKRNTPSGWDCCWEEKGKPLLWVVAGGAAAPNTEPPLGAEDTALEPPKAGVEVVAPNTKELVVFAGAAEPNAGVAVAPPNTEGVVETAEDVVGAPNVPKVDPEIIEAYTQFYDPCTMQTCFYVTAGSHFYLTNIWIQTPWLRTFILTPKYMTDYAVNINM